MVQSSATLIPLTRASYNALYALLAHVKPCGTHLLNPHGMENYISSIVILGILSQDAVEVGRQIARGEVRQENSGIGRLLWEAVRNAYAATKHICEDTLLGGIISTVAYGFATVRGTPSPSILLSSLRTVLNYIGSEDLKYIVKGLEAIAASNKLSTLYDEGFTLSSIESRGLTGIELIQTLSIHGGIYKALLSPQVIMNIAERLAKDFSRKTVISVWLDIINDCAPREAITLARRGLKELDSQPQKALKTLLEADSKCRLNTNCKNRMAVLIVGAYLAALLT